jgi:alpha-aminoadipic semialdehyde synthase
MHFSRVLMPYLRTLVKEYNLGRRNVILQTGEYAEQLQAVDDATIASDGQLRDGHKWLEGPLEVWRKEAQISQNEVSPALNPSILPKKKVLVLGSGMVAGPAIDEIASHGDTELLVGE